MQKYFNLQRLRNCFNLLNGNFLRFLYRLWVNLRLILFTLNRKYHMKFQYCYIAFIFLCLSTASADAQVGIGTTTPNASLDIRSGNQAAPSNTDGILIPKVDAFPAVNPTASQQSMMVYLTSASASNTPGFYYWNNPTTSWIAVGNGWSLTGNSATTPATNFLGTTDDKDLVFKRNNIGAGFIGDPNVTTGNRNTSFGANSLNALGTGTRNTVMGTNVLPSNSTGFQNIAIGDQTMFKNTTGSENTAVGTGALYLSAAGVCNVAIGRNALTSTNGVSGTQGSNNTAVGYVAMKLNTLGAYNTASGREALYSNTTGNNNLALGYESGYSNLTGSSNVFLGNQAGYAETGSNRLYIHNANADAVNALVYGEFDNKIFRANAQIQVNDPATTGYKFPTARGLNNQVLQTDGSGNVSWANNINNLSVMRSTMAADQNLSTGGWQKVNFGYIIFDTNAEFNIPSGRFTALKAGYYQVNAGYHIKSMTGNDYYTIGVRVNGGYYEETGGAHVGSGNVARTINCIVNLNAGDYVEIFAENVASGAVIDGYSGKTYFEVHQIK